MLMSRMNILLIAVFVGIVCSVGGDKHEHDKSAETTDASKNKTTTTEMPSTTNGTSSTENVTLLDNRNTPVVVLQILNEDGDALEEATIDRKVHLTVKLLSNESEFQTPFVKKCWFRQVADADSYGNETTGPKMVSFMENGCLVKGGKLKVDFKESGSSDLRTEPFEIAPLYNEDYTFLKFHCDVFLCPVDEECRVQCIQSKTKGGSIWSMVRKAVKVPASTTLHLKEPENPEEKIPSRDTSLIQTGRQPFTRPTPKPTPAPFYKEYQAVFALSTLGVVILLLICVAYIGYKFISHMRKKRHDDAIRSAAVLDFPDAGHLKAVPALSPPPAYAGHYQLNSPASRPSSSSYHNPSYDFVTPRLQRSHLMPLTEPNDHDQSVFSTSHGADGFHGGRTRFSSTEGLLHSSPQKSHAKAAVVRAALTEYFERHGM